MGLLIKTFFGGQMSALGRLRANELTEDRYRYLSELWRREARVLRSSPEGPGEARRKLYLMMDSFN